MSTPVDNRLRLSDLKRAWDSRDPDLHEQVITLVNQDDEPAAGTPPVRDGAPTFATFLASIRDEKFKKRDAEERRIFRQEQIKALERPDAEVPLSDRLRVHEVLLALWADNGPAARSTLLKIIPQAPFRYGAWRALKRIYKEAEARNDDEILAALIARIDGGTSYGSEVALRTILYLKRRSWRYLRTLGRERPMVYPDVAAEVLANYPDAYDWSGTWVANHILYHELKSYTRTRFRHRKRPSGLENRAFVDLWKRSPRPLFALLERAKSDRARLYAAEALKADFRASIREVEPAWVARLVGVRSRPVDDFVVWILNNVPRFEQGSFRSLGLHEAVLKLFDSPSQDAATYAAGYARTHARDLAVDELIRLADSNTVAVRKLAIDLLADRDPRTEVGLDAWGRLLETGHGFDLASNVLRKHFGAKELTPAWFRDRLPKSGRGSFDYLCTRLLELQPAEKLGPDYFLGLLADSDRDGENIHQIASFVTRNLRKFDLNALPADALKALALRRTTSDTAFEWIDEGKLKAQSLGLEFLKALAYHPEWETDPWLAAFRKAGPKWAREMSFDEQKSERVLGWLKDVRRFSSEELGFAWLLKLAARAEPRYHNFAVETMIKGFTPADFAPKQGEASPSGGTPAAGAASDVDLGGATFLFTGKLATMQRKEAEDKVRDAKGANSSTVSPKLHYLVIGDEGSPLYGNGKKGSKQVKAEELNAAGANIKIISETAFLKMLSGHAPKADSGDAMAGSERLWEMANASGPAEQQALASFAIKYIRRHHPDIALAETDRPVDPGSEIPADFLTLDRVRPLFFETRKPLRDLALELSKYEFARWSPQAVDLVALAECSHADVRNFVANALLAEAGPETRRYRIDPEALGAAAVFRFCESAEEATRALGLQLIERSPKYRLPEELFRLTESPDRYVRGFVIRALWSLYRDRGITAGWKPSVPPSTTVGSAAKKAAAAQAENRGTGAPGRPSSPPASHRELWMFLRRALFELPPPRPDKKVEQGADAEGPAARIKKLPARRAKLELVATLSDLAMLDADFARGLLPLLDDFRTSRGKSERDACLVAATRIRHLWSEAAGPLLSAGA